MDLPKSGFTATVFSAFLRPFIGFLDKRAAPIHHGEIILPGLAAIVTGSKEGKIYLLSTSASNLGGMVAGRSIRIGRCTASRRCR